MGAEDPIIPEEKIQNMKFHGEDGFGDVLPKENDENIETIVSKEHAVNAIKDLCDEVSF